MREATPKLNQPQWLVSAACGIALLYFGRVVLEPLALASVLGFALAPLVRRLRLLGLSQTAATVGAVAAATACTLTLGVVIVVQVREVAHQLPAYREAIVSKLERLSSFALGPVARLEADIAAFMPDAQEPHARGSRGAAVALYPSERPIPVEVRQPRPTATATLSRLFATLGEPVGEAAVVFVLLTFMLLERESVRERLIRLTGETDVARTMQALTDTDAGVSRFFSSLLMVNAAFAVVLGSALAVIGVPHPVLWGALAGLMRFVPYIGVPVAAAVVAAFAAAVGVGWSLMLWSLGLFVVLELVLANFIEPRFYGHTIGLAPIGIIISALFWGALWGPVGLLLSTPLTLCLVVAGRHVRPLAPLTILFGESPSTALGQRLYQRALGGDVGDVLGDARKYVRRHGLARYCDDVLLPAIALGAADKRAGRIDGKLEERVRGLLVNLVETLRGTRTLRRRSSIVEASIGVQLRKLREARLGPSQGSLDVPAGSIVLCAGLATERDELLTELLVRALRDANLDARSVTLDSLAGEWQAADLVAAVFFIHPAMEDAALWRRTCAAMRERLPKAVMVSVRPPQGIDTALADEPQVRSDVDAILRSFSEAIAFARTGRR